MIIMGIDPGLKGGIVHLDIDSQKIIVYRMPVVETSKRIKGKNKIVNIYDIPRLFEAIIPCDEVYLERVGPMSSQGVTSVWRFGEGYGLIKSAVYGRTGREATLVSPQVWKKVFDLSDDKNLSRERAQEMFPLASPQWKTKRARILDEGVTEAVLIAAWGAIVNHGITLDQLKAMVTTEVLI